MHPRLLPALALLWGCGGASPTEPPAVRATTAGGEDVARDVALPEIALYEARLAESEAENEALRAALSSAHRTATESCVGSRRSDDGSDDADDGEETALASADDADASRPVLRLHGPPEAERPAMRTEGISPLAGPDAPRVVAAPPMGALGRLLVTGDAVPAIPATPVLVAPRATTPEAAADPAVSDYQAALRLVSERELDAALRAFDAFLAAHPTHAYADNALYWRAEVFYARHDWTAAARELESLLTRFPGGSKVPDALLRLGMCWERLGDSGRARTYFERVLAEHPDSTAAHMASREDT